MKKQFPDIEKLLLLPGDILLFSGRGFISKFIKLVTCSCYSHIGILSVHQFDNEPKILLYESTSLNNLPCKITGKPIIGVQAQDPKERILTYDGNVWLMRLSYGYELDEEEIIKLSKFLEHYIGCGYDTDGAILSRIREGINVTFESLDKLFCSEYVIASLKNIKRFPLENASKYTPGYAAKQLRKRGIYYMVSQVK